MKNFLDWLFAQIVDEFSHSQNKDKTILWGQLPFSEFLGDGVLFLWNTQDLDPYDIANVVKSLDWICTRYQRDFVPAIRKIFSKPPTKLRCGMARGQIISVGNDKDFVGPCLNVAARLQKTGQFSFAFSKRGFSLDKGFGTKQDDYTLIRIPIRGVGDEELVFVRTLEYKNLSKSENARLSP